MSKEQAKNRSKAENKVPGQKITAKEEEFIRYHRVLRGEVDNANWHFQAWKALWRLMESHIEEFNVAHTFFRLTMRAHLLEAVLRLDKICRQGEDGMNMFVFLDFVRKNLDIFTAQSADTGKHSEREYDIEAELIAEVALLITPGVVEGHIQQIEALPLAKLEAWKDNALDYIDMKRAKGHIKVLEESPVDIEEVDRIIGTLHDILNVYSASYDGQVWEKDLLFEHGIQNMMEAFKVGRQGKAK
jgi:hypothetical protein